MLKQDDMGCNCKTTETIIKIHKQYGNKINVSWKKKFKFRISEFLKMFLLLLIVIILSPFIVIVIVFTIFIGKKNININKLLNILLRKK